MPFSLNSPSKEKEKKRWRFQRVQKSYFGLMLLIHPYFVFASIESSSADLPDPSMLGKAISTIFSCAGPVTVL